MPISQRSVIWSAALGLVGYGAFHVLSLVRRVDDSEKKLHALICAADVIEAYLKANDHAWPGSWSDLRRTGEVQSGSMYRWPEDVDAVQQRVEIDFSVTADDLANPAFDVSRAIRPRGEYIYDPATGWPRYSSSSRIAAHRRSTRTVPVHPFHPDFRSFRVFRG